MNKTNYKLNAIGIIPARYESTRLPGKPLIDICGKTLLQRVWESASKANTLRRIIVATDDTRIKKMCTEIGAECLITPVSLPSGTDRIAFAYKKLADKADIVINIQGDEPLIKAKDIDKLVQTFSDSEFEVGTLIKMITKNKELFNPSVVKVVLGKNNQALYFSRSPIPYLREAEPENWLKKQSYWKHIGIYAYKEKSLLDFIRLKSSALEQSEKLEQLRLLENGANYLCVKTDTELIGVDTLEDLKTVRKYIRDMNKKQII